MSEADFAGVVDANLTAGYRVAKRAAGGMLRLRRGRLIFISSVVGPVVVVRLARRSTPPPRPG